MEELSHGHVMVRKKIYGPQYRPERRQKGVERAFGERRYLHAMAKLKLDLHDIFNKGREIDRALDDLMQEAIDRRIALVEIITGKGSGQLKKKVIRYLQQPAVKKLYHRVEKDGDNFGRLFVHFKH